MGEPGNEASNYTPRMFWSHCRAELTLDNIMVLGTVSVIFVYQKTCFSAIMCLGVSACISLHVSLQGSLWCEGTGTGQ